MKIPIVLSTILICFLSSVKAQTDSINADTIKILKKNTMFIEFGGNGMLYSANYDRFFKISNRFNASLRIGFHYSRNFNKNGIQLIGLPVEMSALYSIYKKKHFIELGTGVTYLNQEDVNSKVVVDLFILALRVGYRYQSPNGGFFLKIGFTPLYDLFVINPERGVKYHTWVLWGGIGIGYTF